MLKQSEETVCFETFISLVAFQLGGGPGPLASPTGYAYVHNVLAWYGTLFKQRTKVLYLYIHKQRVPYFLTKIEACRTPVA